jgi:hypothetical protein
MNNPFWKYLSVEDLEHIKVVNFMKAELPEVIFFHVPNESRKTPFERFKYSVMGNLKGIPDFIFLHPKDEKIEKSLTLFHGLCIELKAPEHKIIIKKGKSSGKTVKKIGKLSEEQSLILQKLKIMGYQSACCFGADEAISVIKEYFKEYLDVKKKLKLK